jgi:hypothetical protein
MKNLRKIAILLVSLSAGCGGKTDIAEMGMDGGNTGTTSVGSSEAGEDGEDWILPATMVGMAACNHNLKCDAYGPNGPYQGCGALFAATINGDSAGRQCTRAQALKCVNALNRLSCSRPSECPPAGCDCTNTNGCSPPCEVPDDCKVSDCLFATIACK